MNLKLSLVLSAFVISGLVYSCKKDDNAQQKTASPVAVSHLARQGSQNPYNYLGALHNNAMDAIASQPNSAALTLPQRHEIIQDYLQQHAGTPRISFSEIKEGVEYAINPATTQGLSQDLQQHGVPADVCADIALMQAKFGNWQDDALTGFEDSVDAFENYVISKYGTSNYTIHSTIDLYTQQGKSAYLLISTAILRHSVAYWSESLNTESSPWYTANRATGAGAGNIFEKAWADVKGFFRGLFGHATDRNNDGMADGYEVGISGSISGACDASSNR